MVIDLRFSKNKFAFFLFCGISIISFAQDDSCDELKNGVFQVYENDSILGVIYRKGNFQLEDYLDGKELNPTRLKEKDCFFYINSVEINEPIDTVTMFVSYQKIKKNYYTFIAKPKYLNIDYEYRGNIRKINNTINFKILEIFKKLELLE